MLHNNRRKKREFSALMSNTGTSSPGGVGGLFPSTSPNMTYETIGSPRVRKLWGPMQVSAPGAGSSSKQSTPKTPQFKPSPPSGGSMRPTPPSGGSGGGTGSGGGGGGRPSPHSRYGLTPRLESTGSLLPQPHFPTLSPQTQQSVGRAQSSSQYSVGSDGATPPTHGGRPPATSRGRMTDAHPSLFGAEETTYPFSWVRQMHAIVLQSAVDLSFGKALERVAEAGKALCHCSHVQVTFSHNQLSSMPGTVSYGTARVSLSTLTAARSGGSAQHGPELCAAVSLCGARLLLGTDRSQ